MIMNLKQKVLIFETPYDISNYLLKQWSLIAEKTLENQDHFRVALAGGKTPQEFYSRLSAFRAYDQWHRTHVCLTDERYCQEDDPNNNYRMIKEKLLNYVSIPEENSYSISQDQKDAQQAADNYQTFLKGMFQTENQEFPSFDFMLLGMGSDGHTASLFPGDSAISEDTSWTLAVKQHALTYERISLSLPVLNHAKNIFFLICGQDKAEMAEKIFIQKLRFPAGCINPVDGMCHYLLDRQAAARLPYLDSFVEEEGGLVVEL